MLDFLGKIRYNERPLTKDFGQMKTKIKLLAISFAALSLTFSSVAHLAEQPPEIKNTDQKVTGIGNIPDVLSLGPGEQAKTFESEPITANFEFNAIAPHW